MAHAKMTVDLEFCRGACLAARRRDAVVTFATNVSGMRVAEDMPVQPTCAEEQR